MIIYGFTKTTLLDYPGHVAATVFTGGCNFRCPFCHNGDLVLNPNIYPRIPEEEVIAHLTKRKNVLTGVCISGGEPTLQSDIFSFAEKIKALGYLIKLDTNGGAPDTLKSLINSNLIDYVAMDIKAGRDNYSHAIGYGDYDLSSVLASADILLNGSIDYEFRTTVVKGIHSNKDFEDIADWIGGCSKYFLQSYKENDAVIDKSCAPFDKETLKHFLDIVKKTIPSAALRGID